MEVGRLITMLGGKAGCGTTTITANLATLIAGTHKTGLLDLDFAMGDVAGVLDIWPERAMPELFADDRGLTQESLWDTMALHASGLRVLTQPTNLEDLLQLRAAEAQELLAVARAMFEVVLADCGPRVDEVMLAAAAEADRLVVLTAPEVPALRDTRRILDLLRRIEIDPERLMLVVNHWGRRGLTTEDIEAQLGVPVSATIVHDERRCRSADFHGLLLPEIANRAPITRDLARLRALLLDEPAPRPAWLQALVGRRAAETGESA